MKEKGFTLVELLGVLIILTIIILVLFPTISTYINNTKEKSFDSEMKIITTSLKNYAEGHKEILPFGNDFSKDFLYFRTIKRLWNC